MRLDGGAQIDDLLAQAHPQPLSSGSTGIPKGKRNIQNRGISGYEPISWDEATDIVTDEIIRVRREFGPSAMMSTTSSHHLWGNVGYRFSSYYRFMNLAGFCYAEHNPDSWEGWLWGGMHMWGFSHRLGIPEQYDLLEDALKNTEMVVFWSCDPETTQGAYGCFESTPRRFWLKDLGVKMVFIDPYFNNTAGLHADKWLAPRPGTDVCLALAIAYTWLTEGTYDKDYIDRLTVGFDEWKAYVLGESDGKPKTPEWAEVESGVPAREIRALAQEWGRKKTMLGPGGSRRHGRSLPDLHRQRVGPLHDRSGGHAGHGQAGQQHLVDPIGRSHRLLVLLPRVFRGRHLR